MAKIVALLDSMWGWGGYNDAGEDAPRYFRINPENHSGRRLYSLCGDNHLLVTNCCRKVVASANEHGVPDSSWVAENMKFLRSEGTTLFLICGKVAQKTFEGCFSPTDRACFRYLYIDHPAARRWSRAKIHSVTEEIARICRA